MYLFMYRHTYFFLKDVTVILNVSIAYLIKKVCFASQKLLEIQEKGEKKNVVFFHFYFKSHLKKKKKMYISC